MSKGGRIRWLGIAVLGGLMLAGCGAAFEPTPTPIVYDGGGMLAPTQATPADVSGFALAGTSWKLTQIGVTPVGPAVGATLVFGNDGKVSGSGGCNSFGGGYTVSGSTITFSELASTLMACEGPRMDVEGQYLGALQGTGTFSLGGGTLVITGAKDVRLTFASGK